MPDTNGPARRLAGLTPLLVATVAVIVAAVALTVSGAANAFVIVMWVAVAVVGGATISVALRR
jgi:hypothetical protein